MKMKNKSIFLILILVCSFGLAQSGPKIEFKAQDNTIDYGSISKKNDNGVRSIEFINTGDSPLMVISVLSTPGFSILSKPNDAIVSGKSGKIEIKYNMVPGPIRKTITVETNAVNYEGARTPLKIKGEVLAN
jgi:hypothetical protein